MVMEIGFQPPAKDYSLQEVFAGNVKRLMDRRHVTNIDRFAMYVGVASETMRSLLAAKNDLRLSTVKQIANAVGLEAHVLLDPTFDPATTPPYLRDFPADLHLVIGAVPDDVDRPRPQPHLFAHPV